MKNQYIHVALKPVMVSGALCVTYFLAFYFMGTHLFDGAMGFDVFIPLPFCGITLFFFKKYYNNGELRFWQGMILSEGVVFGSLILLSFYLMLHFYFFDTTYLQESITVKNNEMLRNKDLYIASGRTEKEIYHQIEQLKLTTVGVILANKILWFGALGFLYSLLLSIVFRK